MYDKLQLTVFWQVSFMKVLTVWSPETPPDGDKCQAEGKQTHFQFITMQSTFDQEKGETVTVFLFPKLFLECERTKSSLLKNLSRAGVDILMLIETLVDPRKSTSVWAWLGNNYI